MIQELQTKLLMRWLYFFYNKKVFFSKYVEENVLSIMIKFTDNIASESKKVFEDVEEEFAQLHRVMARFESWKSVETTSYDDAYVSYNLSKIFAPYIRLFS